MKNKYLYSLLIILFTILLISGCQNKSEQIYEKYKENPENDIYNTVDNSETSDQDAQKVYEDITGELKIYVRNTNDTVCYDWLCEKFNKRYPNVRFSFTGSESEFSSMSERLTKTSVDLMSGMAGDIIDVTGLPYIQFAKNNLLDNLYPYMENDETFHIEDYYGNIFNALEYNDKLYCMPMGFSYWCARFNTNLLNENKIDIPKFDSVNYKDISDIYHEIAIKNDELLVSSFWNQLIFEDNEYISYVNENRGTASFDSMEYISFLKEMKSIRWLSEEEISKSNYWPFDYCNTLNENDLCSFVSSQYNEERNASLFSNKMLNVTDPIPLAALNGDKSFLISDQTFAIISASKNKELAWLFIRFCIEERKIEEMDSGNNWFLTGYPINRKNAKKQLEEAFGPEQKEYIEKVDLWNSERNYADMLNYRYYLLSAIKEISNDFYNGRMTAEECAEQVQERVEIYLKE